MAGVPSNAVWDLRHAQNESALPAPDPILAQARQFLPDRGSARLKAADLACGGGRNAIQLSKWGLDTVAIDWSSEALRLSSVRAAAAGCSLRTELLDLEAQDIDLGGERFDFVTVIHYLHRPLFPAIRRCVRSGGIVAYKTYTLDQLQFAKGPKNPDHLLRPGELAGLFHGFEIVLYRESTCESEATAALVARRP